MLLGTEYREITLETAQSLAEKQLYNVVEELKIAAGLRFMPRVYIDRGGLHECFCQRL